MDSTSLTNIITPVLGVILLFVITKFYEKAVNMFVEKVLHRPSPRQISNNYLNQKIASLVDNIQDDLNAEVKYKEDVRLLVTRGADNLVSNHRDIVRDVIVKASPAHYKRCFHLFTSAGESLKIEIMKIYLKSAELNGFNHRSQIEWSNLLETISDSVLHKSVEHYDIWFVSDEIPSNIISDVLWQNKHVFSEISNDLMNVIREKSNYNAERSKKLLQAREDIQNSLNESTKK
jgi:hypothetical protein